MPVNLSPISSVVAALQAQIAAAMDRDLAMMMQSSASGGATAKPGALSKGAAPQALAPGVASAAAPAEVPPAGRPPVAQSPVTQAVQTARLAAAGRQSGMAPLFADLERALASQDLPAPVKAAVRQILALQTPLDKPVTGQVVARAVAQSGVFLEAHIAAGGDEPPPPDLKAALLTLREALTVPDAKAATPALRAATPSPAAPAREPASPAPAARTAPGAAAPAPPAPAATPNAALPSAPVLARGIEQALVRQSAVAPLLADLAKALDDPALPAPVRTAIAQVLAQRAPHPPAAPPGAQPTARPAAPALVPELAIPATAVAEEADAPPPGDLKSALLSLRQAVAAPGGERSDPPASRALPPPAPPTRDAGTTAQAPIPSKLPEHADAATLTQALARGVDQAVARQTLHQLASLPDGGPQAWMFELPLATPQGAAIAQFEIGREGPGGGRDGCADGWRVRFSIDMEPLGPLHVHLHAGGGRASVNVWAERPASLAPLRALGGELSHALQAEVRFQTGAPSQPAPQPGRFLDAST